MRRYLPLLMLMLFVSCQPGQDSKSVTSGNIIVDGDDRTNISGVYPRLQQTAGAVATIIPKNQVIDNQDGTLTIKAFRIDENLCPEEKFKDAIQYGMCSAFRIGADAIATAGHCLEQGLGLQSFCENYRFVFNFNHQGTSQGQKLADRIVKASQVVSCEQIAYYSEATRDDLAILNAKMDESIPTLKISERELNAKERVVKVGHGHGYLANFSHGRVTKVDKYKLSSTNDIFGGDSGAPLLNAKTHEVVGVIVRAVKAHIKFRERDSDRSCYLEPMAKNESEGKATTMKANTIIIPALKSINNKNLISKAINEPTVANVEAVKNEIDPNLHFSIFNGKFGVPFMIAVLHVNKFSLDLLKELSNFVTEEMATELLLVGKWKDEKFAEAIYDMFSGLVEYENLSIAADLVDLVPDSRLKHHLDKYEDEELVALAIVMYQKRVLNLPKAIALRPNILSLAKNNGNEQISLWDSMNHSNLTDGKVLIQERNDELKFNQDLEILKAYYGFQREDVLMTEEGLTQSASEKIMSGPEAFAQYMRTLISWKFGQSKI